MTKKDKLSRTLAVGGLTAAVALLVGLSEANAQAPAPAPPLSGAGSFPLSFIVPGTNTSLHVGGFVQFDARYQMSSFGGSTSPGADYNIYPGAVAIEGNGVGTAAGHSLHGTLYMTAQSSRVQLETRTPSAYGEVKTFIEFDFSGSASASGTAGLTNTTTGATQEPSNFLDLPRLKQAYGTLGPFAIGQFSSNYADLAAWPDGIFGAVAAGIPDGPGTAFVPQARYTYLLPQGISLSGSVEYNDTGGYIGTSNGASPLAGGAPGVPAGQAPSFNDYNAPGVIGKFPAFTGTAQVQQPWGHTAFHVVVANTDLRNVGGVLGGALGAAGAGTTPPAGLSPGGHIQRWGYQTSVTGHINTIGRDKIVFNAEYGQGADGYSWDMQNLGLQTIEDLVCSLNGTTTALSQSIVCSQPRNVGGNLQYVHFWNDQWRSAVDVGYATASKPNAAATWIATTPSNAGVSNVLTDLEPARDGVRLYRLDPDRGRAVRPRIRMVPASGLVGRAWQRQPDLVPVAIRLLKSGRTRA